MKFTFIPAFIFLTNFTAIQAQCPDFTLANLQTLQHIDVQQKEARVLEMGFEISSETPNSRRYNKCWNHTNDKRKPIYDQVVSWNKQTNNITFYCLSEEAFLRLRQSIEERRGTTTSLGQSDFYIGKRFKYEFSIQKIDGLEYFAVAISLK